LQDQKITDGLLWEVILVDNGSTDETISFSKKIWSEKNVCDFTILSEEKKGQTYARLKGLKSAKYNFVSFIDDDNRVDKNWVSVVNDIFLSHPDCAVCGGIGKAVFEDQEPQWFKHFEANFAVGPQGKKSGYVERDRSYLYGAGLSVQKEYYLKLVENGFPEIQTGRLVDQMRGGGEDSELCFCFVLSGYKLWYDERLKFEHLMPKGRMTVEYLKKLQMCMGRDEVILSIYRSYVSTRFRTKKNYFLEYLATYYHWKKNKQKKKIITEADKFNEEMHDILIRSYLQELLYFGSKLKEIRKKIDYFAQKPKIMNS
jgi:glycosyltransferase involved in cell wall biosynthesis